VFGGYNLNEILDSLHIYRFASNMWENEVGIPLQNTQMSRKIDKHLLRAVLQEDDMGTNQYGLNKKASFFGNFLLSALSETENVASQSHQRRSSEDFVVLDEILETIRPSARYGHAAVRYKCERV
jgi:multipile epidermal growth factor-like domains protein 8